MQSIILEKKTLWGLSFFGKYWKFYVHFGNTEKIWENPFQLGYNCISTGCIKHSLLLRENICHRVSICWQTVSRFQILLRQNFVDLIFFHNDQKIGQKYCHSDLSSVPDCLTCSLPISVLTRRFFRHLSNPAFCRL